MQSTHVFSTNYIKYVQHIHIMQSACITHYTHYALHTSFTTLATFIMYTALHIMYNTGCIYYVQRTTHIMHNAHFCSLHLESIHYRFFSILKRGRNHGLNEFAVRRGCTCPAHYLDLPLGSLMAHRVSDDRLGGRLQCTAGDPVCRDPPLRGHHTGFICWGSPPLWELPEFDIIPPLHAPLLISPPSYLLKSFP